MRARIFSGKLAHDNRGAAVFKYSASNWLRTFLSSMVKAPLSAVQGLETLLFVLQIFWSADKLLNGFYVKKLVDIVVVS
jgi:hypothetical protein